MKALTPDYLIEKIRENAKNTDPSIRIMVTNYLLKKHFGFLPYRRIGEYTGSTIDRVKSDCIKVENAFTIVDTFHFLNPDFNK